VKEFQVLFTGIDFPHHCQSTHMPPFDISMHCDNSLSCSLRRQLSQATLKYIFALVCFSSISNFSTFVYHTTYSLWCNWLLKKRCSDVVESSLLSGFGFDFARFTKRDRWWIMGGGATGSFMSLSVLSDDGDLGHLVCGTCQLWILLVVISEARAV
jgi:hypothetical protein